MRKLHIMLDLETLGKTIMAPVVQIAAVCAVEDDDGVWHRLWHLTGATFDDRINFDNAMVGRKPSGSTLAWWMRQSEEARAMLTQAHQGEDDFGCSVERALERFTVWVREMADHCAAQEVYLWGNGSTDDNAWLKSLYEQWGLDMPVEYWGHRCYRTVKDLYRNVPRPPAQGVAHDGLSDAINQMTHLMLIMNERNAECRN